MIVASLLAGLLPCAAAAAVPWRDSFNNHYDVVVLGTGLKESLLSGLLASHGKRVLQLERGAVLGGSSASLGLQELAERTEGPGAELSEAKLGPPDEYRVEPAPKMFMASGDQLQLLVASGAWQHMNPPGFKRVHRSLIYRKRPDGAPDVHRVLANSEDVLKTRMLSALEKARAVQFFLWVDKYDEEDARTHQTSPLSKTTLDLHKISAAKFLTHWELPEALSAMMLRGMALFVGPPKLLKKMRAVDLVRRLKRYKDAYRTFPHMTSPYVYPVGGFGTALPKAMGGVLEAQGGACYVGRPIDAIATDEGGACGVTSEGATVTADCVVAGPDYAPDRVSASYQIVRLYAVLAHPPNMCKDAKSCQLLLPAASCGRKSDVYLMSAGPTHGVAPRGKWLAVVSARVEGPTDGLDALAIAKRELGSVMPLLKPSRRLFAEVSDYCEPTEGAQLERLVVLSSLDETSYFDSVEADVDAAFERITGETVASVRRPN